MKQIMPLVVPKGDLPENVVLKISKRARRMALRLDEKNRVINLVVPQRASLKKAYAFAHQHSQWIQDKLAALPEQVLYEDGVILPLFGRKTQLRILYDGTLKSTSCILKNNELLCITNKEDPAGRISRFLKEETRKVISDLARDKAATINKKIREIQIRDTRSRWGSCGPDRRISFSWRLVFAPWKSLDYVVAHEVAHLRHMNHGPRFWALCEELSADYEHGKRWMREHGHELMRYGS